MLQLQKDMIGMMTDFHSSSSSILSDSFIV